MSHTSIFRALSIDILPYSITKKYISKVKGSTTKLDPNFTHIIGKILMKILDINIYTQLKYSYLIPMFLYLAIQLFGFHYLCIWFYLLGKTGYENPFIIYTTGLFPLLYFGIPKYILLLSFIFFVYDLYECLQHNGIPIIKVFSFIIHRSKIMWALYKHYDCGLGKLISNESTTTIDSYHILFDKEYNVVLLNDDDYNLISICSLPFPHFISSYGDGIYKEFYTYTGTSVFVPIQERSKRIEFVEGVYTIIPNVMESKNMYKFKKIVLGIGNILDSYPYKFIELIDSIHITRYIRYVSSQYLTSRLYFKENFANNSLSHLPKNITVPYTSSVMTSHRIDPKSYEKNSYRHVMTENKYIVYSHASSPSNQNQLTSTQNEEFDEF